MCAVLRSALLCALLCAQYCAVLQLVVCELCGNSGNVASQGRSRHVVAAAQLADWYWCMVGDGSLPFA